MLRWLLKIGVAFVVVAAALALLASEAPAQACTTGGSPRAILSLMNSGNSLCIQPAPMPPVLIIDIVADVVPERRIRFSLPDPPFGQVLGTTYNFPATGDRVTGVELDLGGCTGPGRLTLGFVLVSLPAGAMGGCFDWKIDDGAETVGCDGVVHAAYTTHQVFGDAQQFCPHCDIYSQECFALPPYDLRPACGATEVPLNVALEWTSGLFSPEFVRIGTNPDLNAATMFHVAETDPDRIVPGFLQPGTTYYWQVSWDPTGSGGCVGGESPIQSFTTMDTTPVEGRTWGLVKRHYR